MDQGTAPMARVRDEGRHWPAHRVCEADGGRGAPGAVSIRHASPAGSAPSACEWKLCFRRLTGFYQTLRRTLALPPLSPPPFGWPGGTSAGLAGHEADAGVGSQEPCD
ncbi:hypothetical protein SKAU_G00171200 [Synaphobranchus kaupii]|uniref:Uncharacterized protein n=1 Tax=Synaphobranchus kaupii TaxID=118154 RepID=A0A9Q1FKF0_SYNKA|nr:hypothetical protein SKAU_G00171200 [Synaphobranchus kaupii]